MRSNGDFNHIHSFQSIVCKGLLISGSLLSPNMRHAELRCNASTYPTLHEHKIDVWLQGFESICINLMDS